VLEDTDIDELKAMLGLNRSKQGMKVDLEQFQKIVDQTPAANSGGTETGSWLTQLHLDEVLIPLIDEYEYLPQTDDSASSQVTKYTYIFKYTCICTMQHIHVYMHVRVCVHVSLKRAGPPFKRFSYGPYMT